MGNQGKENRGNLVRMRESCTERRDLHPSSLSSAGAVLLRLWSVAKRPSRRATPCDVLWSHAYICSSLYPKSSDSVFPATISPTIQKCETSSSSTQRTRTSTELGPLRARIRWFLSAAQWTHRWVWDSVGMGVLKGRILTISNSKISPLSWLFWRYYVECTSSTLSMSYNILTM